MGPNNARMGGRGGGALVGTCQVCAGAPLWDDRARKGAVRARRHETGGGQIRASACVHVWGHALDTQWTRQEIITCIGGSTVCNLHGQLAHQDIYIIVVSTSQSCFLQQLEDIQ